MWSGAFTGFKAGRIESKAELLQGWYEVKECKKPEAGMEAIDIWSGYYDR